MHDFPLVPEGLPLTSFERTVTVIDASALVAYVLREERWEVIEGLLREGPRSVELLPLEAANAILVARRRKRVNSAEANEALRTVQGLSDLAISLAPHTPLVAAAWAIAHREDVTVYDAVYLALAHAERTALASRDASQIQAARNLGIRVIET